MKKLRRLMVPIILIVTMISQVTIAYQLPDGVDQSVKDELKNSARCIEVPVMYQGNITSHIIAPVSKVKTDGNANEQFNITGYAVFDIKAFAYQTGSSENVKVGATITYKDINGITRTDWWDQGQQANSLAEAKTKLGWPECTGYYLEVLDNIDFVLKYQNATELAIILQMKGKGEEATTFTRNTAFGVKVLKTYQHIKIDAKNRTGSFSKKYNTVLYDEVMEQREIFNNNLTLGNSAKAALTIEGNDLKKVEYQFVTTPVVPGVGNTGWNNLAVKNIPNVISGLPTNRYITNETVNFPDNGTYYVAIQTTSADGIVGHVLNGPFSTIDITPVVTPAADKNFIAPETLSNIAYDIKFKEYSKEITYELDLHEIKDANVSGKPLMDFKLDDAIVTITETKGGTTTSLVKGAGIGEHYTWVKDTTDSKIIISLNNDFRAVKDSKQTINVYLPTNMGENINYKEDYYEKYIDITPNKTEMVTVTAKTKPRIKEAVTNPAGTIIESEEYGTEDIIQNIELKYAEMPKVF